MSEFDRMVEVLDSMWESRDQIVPCLIGPVGIGKTAAVNQHAKNVGAKNVVTIIASQILPSEVSGITMPDDKTKSMQIYDHYRLSSLQDGDILFFDELLEADQCVLSACLTLIESRMMMSGRLLPDIQIIAATNPTVSPTSLKESIRQRFMFMEFKLDKEQCKDYIAKQTGIYLSDQVLGRLESTSSNYNILSPRSLTKLCTWMSRVKEDHKLSMSVANTIDSMWGSTLGSQIRSDMYNSVADPKTQVHNFVEQAVFNAYKEKYVEDVSKNSAGLTNRESEAIQESAKEYAEKKVSEKDIEKIVDLPFDQMLQELSKLEVWDEVMKQLSTVTIKGKPDVESDIEF